MEIPRANVVSWRHLSATRRDENLEWLRGLAEQGLASAQLLLAQVHSEGRGVSQDRTQAYRLFLLAENSDEVIVIGRSAKQKLAGEMSPMEIAEAERQAASWIEENRKQAKPLLVGGRIQARAENLPGRQNRLRSTGR